MKARSKNTAPDVEKTTRPFPTDIFILAPYLVLLLWVNSLNHLFTNPHHNPYFIILLSTATLLFYPFPLYPHQTVAITQPRRRGFPSLVFSDCTVVQDSQES